MTAIGIEWPYALFHVNGTVFIAVFNKYVEKSVLLPVMCDDVNKLFTLFNATRGTYDCNVYKSINNTVSVSQIACILFNGGRV